MKLTRAAFHDGVLLKDRNTSVPRTIRFVTLSGRCSQEPSAPEQHPSHAGPKESVVWNRLTIGPKR
jgi:hypothetical protein